MTPTTVGSLLETCAATHPDRVAVHAVRDRVATSITYAELFESARRRACDIRERTTEAGKVAVLAPNSVEWLITLYGTALAGRQLVPLNPALSSREVEQHVLDCGAELLVTASVAGGRDLVAESAQLTKSIEPLRAVIDLDDWAHGSVVNDQLPEVAPDQTFLVQYTSGTTGQPKGALLSHAAVTTSARTMTDALEPGEHEIWVSPMPLFHVGALIAHVVALAGVAGTYVMQTRFDPAEQLALAEATQATLIAGVPTIYLGILAQPDLATMRLGSLQKAMLGGASIAPDLVAGIERELGVTVAVLYGQSESPAITQTSLDDDPATKAETIGRALPGRELRIVEPGAWTDLPDGEVGELTVRSPTNMTGYLGRPDETAEALTSGGWLRTGDLCSIDESGLVRFHGRLREVILRGGENVYAREVENALMEHPAVALAAVIGSPDERWGELVVAVVQLQPGCAADHDALEAYLIPRLARFKIPDRWRFVDHLPLTASGKIQKHRLLEQRETD